MTEPIAWMDIKRLWGQSFTLPQLDRSEVEFSIPRQEGRRGFEGYGLIVDCHHPIKNGFLKIFRLPVLERHERTKFLISTLALSKQHWLFQGLPFGALQNVPINGLPITGYVTRLITMKAGGQATDLAHLMTNKKWTYDLGTRKRFCGQLCCAAVTLEALDLVHGDISLGNVMIGTDINGAEAAVLCDFDAFYHPTQRLLPLTVDQKPCRPSGSEGFQYPELLADIFSKNPNVCVRTDRFALGAIICQMMTWDTDTDERLRRKELLRSKDIAARDLSGIPDFVRTSWPDGYQLLVKSFKAMSIRDLPGPRDWLALVGGPAAPSTGDLAEHTIIVQKRRGRTVLLRQPVSLKSAAGTFGRVDDELEEVGFSHLGDKILLEFGWAAP